MSGADRYNLYWATASGVTKETGIRVAGVSSPFDHTGLTNGTTYFYVVTAENASGESGESVQVSAAPANASPVAGAGTDQTAATGGSVTLDGTGSGDPDGDALTYAWTQVSGATVTLSNPATAQPTFTAPQHPRDLRVRARGERRSGDFPTRYGGDRGRPVHAVCHRRRRHTRQFGHRELLDGPPSQLGPSISGPPPDFARLVYPTIVSSGVQSVLAWVNNIELSGSAKDILGVIIAPF